MPRHERTDFAGAWHHVMNRGAARRDIFRDDTDRTVFLDLVGEVMPELGMEVHAYALMPNHYHLLLRSTRGHLSRSMQLLGARYTRWFNLRGQSDGAVFRGRFHSKRVQDDEHLRWLVAYLHLNPVRTGSYERAIDAPWTSHRAYLGMAPIRPWLETRTLLGMIGGREHLVDLVDGLDDGVLTLPDDLDVSHWSAPTATTQPGPNPTVGAQEIETLFEAMSELTGLDRGQLLLRKRGRNGNPARRFVVWALATTTDLPLARIAALVQMSPSQAATVLTSLRQDAAPQPLSEWMDAWRGRSARPEILNSECLTPG